MHSIYNLIDSMIISNRCFDKNTFKQNTMEIQVEYE